MTSVTGIDHVAFQVRDIEATYEFYRRVLGAEAPFLDQFRRGEKKSLRIEIGHAVFNLHPSPSFTDLIALEAGPAGADICLRWNEPISAAVERLREAGVEIVEGPAQRIAWNREIGQSVYFRDPDGNLIELLTIVGAD